MTDDANAAKAPASFWIVAVLSLLWNAFGGFDYTMTKTRNADYLANFPPEMMPFLDAMPMWATVCWAFGVWGALAGSILLLLRSRQAVLAFLISLVGAFISFGYQFSLEMPASLRTPAMLSMTAVIIVLTVFFWWYARLAATKGYLR